MPLSTTRKWTLLAAGAAAAVLFFSGTGAAWAFMTTANDTLSNRFSVSECKVKIEEDFVVPEKVEPGSSIVKTIRFTNRGKGDCFIRAFVQFDDESCADWATIDFNDKDWPLSSDGYRYYKSPVEDGGVTSPICTKVTISSNATPSQLKSFDVIASCEATPAKSPSGKAFSSAQDAFSHKQGL